MRRTSENFGTKARILFLCHHNFRKKLVCITKQKKWKKAKNVQNLVKDPNLQIQEAQWIQQKDKDLYAHSHHRQTAENWRQEKYFESSQRKVARYLLGKNDKNDYGFFIGKHEARNKQASICKVLKESNCQSRILYLEKISFENEDTIKMVLKTILENLLLVDMLSNNCWSKFFRQKVNATNINLEQQKWNNNWNGNMYQYNWLIIVLIVLYMVESKNYKTGGIGSI